MERNTISFNLEINEKHKQLLSAIIEEYHYYNLVKKLNDIQEYTQNIKKALKKGLIDVNTHRVTSSYYNQQKTEISV